jgi:hypothetical protein
LLPRRIETRLLPRFFIARAFFLALSSVDAVATTRLLLPLSTANIFLSVLVCLPRLERLVFFLVAITSLPFFARSVARDA